MIKIGKHEIPNEIGTHEIPGGKVIVSRWDVRVVAKDRGRTVASLDGSDEARQAAVNRSLAYMRADIMRDARYWRPKADAAKRVATIRKDEAAEVARLQKKIATVQKRAATERKRAPKAVARSAEELAACQRELAVIKAWGAK